MANEEAIHALPVCSANVAASGRHAGSRVGTGN